MSHLLNFALLEAFALPIKLWVILGLVALVGGFVLLVIIVSLCERQRLTGDVEPAQPPYPYSPTRYWQATRDDALRLGLRHGGDFATKKNASMVKGLQSLFITPDNDVLVSIIDGSFGGTKLKKTILRTRFSTGRVLESSDNPGINDFSGVIDRAVLLNAGVAEMMEFHRRRMQSVGMGPMTFNPNALLDEYERIDLDRGSRWVMLGLARWADPQQTSIRLTLRGSFAQVRNLFGTMNKLEDQSHRSFIRRAGARPGDA